MGRIQGDLLQRTFAFAVQIVKLVEGLPANNGGWVIGRQLIRCGTAVGANVREANNGHTEADFAYQCNVARKEASETGYWLDLCEQTGILNASAVDPVRRAADELTRILSAVVIKTQSHQRAKAQSGVGDQGE